MCGQNKNSSLAKHWMSAFALQAYRELFLHGLTGEDVHKIEHAMQHKQPLGDNHFRRQIEQQYGIEFGRSTRGRPCK